MDEKKAPLNPYIALGAGIVAASFATTFIRLTQEAGMSSLSLATIRLTLVAIIFAPIALRRGGNQLAMLTRREWAVIALAGVFLAMHFTVFLTSLEYTSVLNTQVLNATTPIFSALLGWVILRETVGRTVIIGIVLALAGVFIVASGGASGEPPKGAAPLLGNSLAISAAIFLSMYFIVGRSIRGKVNWLTYSWLVFAFASLTFLVIKVFNGTQILGYSWEAYFWALMVTLFAQLITHTSFNYALGHISATMVSLTNMLMPAGAAVVAALILRENPGLAAVIGSVVILAGVGLANLSR